MKLLDKLTNKITSLSLTRRVGESIKIGDDIFISITRIQKNQTTLNFKLPKSIKVLRTELEVKADDRF